MADRSLFQLQIQMLPWHRAICSAFSISLPAVFAHLLGNDVGMLLGAIGGLYVSMIDFGGALRYRLQVQMIGAGLILSSAVIGLLLVKHPLHLLPVLVVLTFCIGWTDGTGIAWENTFRVAILAMLVFGFTPTPDIMSAGLPYAILGFALGMGIVWLDSKLFPGKWGRNPPKFRYSLKRILRGETAGFRHGLAFALTCSAALCLALLLEFERPAWLVAATLFVFRPDGPDSLRKLFQTLIGTLVGLAFSWFAVKWIHYPPILLLLAFIFGFLRPIALTVNYGCHAVVMTCLVLILLDIAYLPEGGDLALLRVRLSGLLMGSAVALAGVLICNKQARQHLLK